MTNPAPVVAKAEMLIRKPVPEVFEAFVDPALTAHFWFTRGSGRLETGKEVQWHWDMYGFSTPVRVRSLEPNESVILEWGAPDAFTRLEWLFTARPDGTTFVTLKNDGFLGTPEEIVQQAIDSTEGFTFVLAAAKAYLEHGVHLNLVGDRHPDGLPSPEPATP
jgi:uncharacterized protein YndB with AHSA1/START domain